MQATHKHRSLITQGKLDPKVGLEFLLTELGCGFTFAWLAESGDPGDKPKIERNIENARKAYETVLRFQDRVALNEHAIAQIDAALNQLQARLQTLDQQTHDQNL